MHYLDNAATTLVDPQLAKICYETMTTVFGNPSSLYRSGMQAERAVDHARAQVAATFGVTAAEITFTACGSESDNIALQGAAERTEKWAKNIVATGYEHPAIGPHAGAAEPPRVGSPLCATQTGWQNRRSRVSQRH